MKRLFIMVAILVSLVVVPLGTALAYEPLGAACAVNSQSAVCNHPVEPISGSGGVLARVTKLIAAVAGVVAIILIIISGIFFVTANGEASKISSARATLVGAIIGLVIVAAAQAILNFVISKV